MPFQIQRRTCILELGPEYAGAEVRCRLDVDLELYFDLTAIDVAKPELVRQGMVQFAERVLVSWDITDEDGTVIPPTPEGMLRLPPALAMAIVTAWGAGATAIPLVSGAASPNGATSAAVPETTGQ